MARRAFLGFATGGADTGGTRGYRAHRVANGFRDPGNNRLRMLLIGGGLRATPTLNSEERFAARVSDGSANGLALRPTVDYNVGVARAPVQARAAALPSLTVDLPSAWASRFTSRAASPTSRSVTTEVTPLTRRAASRMRIGRTKAAGAVMTVSSVSAYFSISMLSAVYNRVCKG